MYGTILKIYWFGNGKSPILKYWFKNYIGESRLTEIYIDNRKKITFANYESGGLCDVKNCISMNFKNDHYYLTLLSKPVSLPPSPPPSLTCQEAEEHSSSTFEVKLDLGMGEKWYNLPCGILDQFGLKK